MMVLIEFTDGSYSVSDIKNYIDYIVKIINMINNRLDDGYKLELQAPETMKLFGRTKKIIKKIKKKISR